MANNHPNVEEVDPELAALKGKVPGIESAFPEEKTEPKDPVPPVKDTPPEAPIEKPKEEVVPPKDEKKPEEIAPAPVRPLKYIPIAQYTAEKKKWQDDSARLAEFETAANATKGSKEAEDAIKGYAEQYGVSEDSVRGLVTVFNKANPNKETPPVQQPSISQEDQDRVDQANLVLAEKAFGDEFTTLALPQLKSMYPNATAEQLAAAQQEVEKLACTEGYLDKPLDFVVFKNRETLDKIFPEPRKGPDSGRAAADRGQKPSYGIEDFASGKASFAELGKMSAEDQNKIIEAMDPKTYSMFASYVDQNQALVINRGGRKL